MMIESRINPDVSVPTQRAEILKGIAAYKSRQKAITDAIADAGGELGQDDFDVRFRRQGNLLLPLGGEGAMGGAIRLDTSLGFYSEMLHLTQLMCFAGILETKGTVPNIRYALRQIEKEGAVKKLARSLALTEIGWKQLAE